jgi:hypothetical protein
MGVTLPALLAAGLVLRPSQTPDERVIDRITLRLPNGTEMVADSRELFGNAVDAPDPLVYWAPEAGQGDGRGPGGPPREARLVGSLQRGRRAVLRVPATGGYLVLYSLAHHEVVATAPALKEMP